jgi:hypothetical protein
VCEDKCCEPGELCGFLGCFTPNSGFTVPSIDVAWNEVFTGSALAPMVNLVGFEQRVGARFEIHAAPRPSTHIVLQAKVVDIEAPHRMVFDWIAPGMNAPATAAFTIQQTETETLFGVNRVAGDPTSCDLATSMLGSNWRTRLFMDTVSANLKRLQITPE